LKVGKSKGKEKELRELKMGDELLPMNMYTITLTIIILTHLPIFKFRYKV
jgi:hypothetical protein